MRSSLKTLEESKLVQARCLNCGGELDFDNAADSVTCDYCRTMFLIHRKAGSFEVRMLGSRMDAVAESTANTFRETTRIADASIVLALRAQDKLLVKDLAAIERRIHELKAAQQPFKDVFATLILSTNLVSLWVVQWEDDLASGVAGTIDLQTIAVVWFFVTLVLTNLVIRFFPTCKTVVRCETHRQAIRDRIRANEGRIRDAEF